MSDPFSRTFNPFAEPGVGSDAAGGQADRLFENDPMVSGIVHWSWEIPTNLVIYSREWRHILLRPNDDTVQTTLSSWWPLVHEDDVKSFLEAARDIAEGVTEDYQTLFRVKRADGRWAWLLSRGRVVEKEGGRPLLMRGTLVDISFLRTDVKFLHGNADMSYPHRHATPQRERAPVKNGTGPPPALLDGTSSASLHYFPGIQAISHPDTGMLPGDMGVEQSDFVQACIDRVFSEGLALCETMSFATEYGHNVTGE